MVHSQTATIVETLIPDRRKRWAVILLFWLAVSLLSSLHWELFYFGRNPYTWWELFRAKAALWYVWGFCTPFLLWFAGRYQLEGGSLARRLPILVGASVVFTAAYIVLYTGVLYLNARFVEDIRESTFAGLLDWVIGVHSSWYYLAFWVTIGIENAAIYYSSFRDREIRTARLETELAAAQLAALRNQLQPHFLFNTLHTILALVRVKDQATAERMLTALSDLLRQSLDHVKQHETSLREELGFLRRYIEIEQIRFSDRLRVEWEIDPDTLDARVPAFVLQPLAENAIRHGIEKRPGPGHIGITAGKSAGSVMLEVRDNGAGIEPPGLDRGQYGHGLGGLRTRLQVLYPGRHSLDIVSGNGTGTTVRLTLPWKPATAAPAVDGGAG
ncbi:MAG: sensor histidine kinase [Candidatus Zixiibacteriota bacterium]